MRQIGFLVVVTATLLVVSCSEAKHPIDEEAKVKIDSRLLGKWGATDLRKSSVLIATDAGVIYKLTKQNDDNYHIVCKQGTRKKTLNTTGYLSVIDSALFMNVLADDTDGYFFIRILSINAKEGKVIVANIADTTMMLLTSAAQVRERITKNLSNPLFYKDTAEFYRVK